MQCVCVCVCLTDALAACGGEVSLQERVEGSPGGDKVVGELHQTQSSFRRLHGMGEWNRDREL